MVNVKVTFKVDTILGVEIKDHANSNVHGQDLVCAAVSCISVGSLNALNELVKDTCELFMDDAHVSIVVKDITCHKTQVILNTLYIQLLTIEENYGESIKITKVEV